MILLNVKTKAPNIEILIVQKKLKRKQSVLKYEKRIQEMVFNVSARLMNVLKLGCL